MIVFFIHCSSFGARCGATSGSQRAKYGGAPYWGGGEFRGTGPASP